MLAAVLLTENNRYNLLEQLQTALVMLSVIATALVFMLLANKLNRFIGDAGASIISRVMGLILAAVAVDSVLEGIKSVFSLGT